MGFGLDLDIKIETPKVELPKVDVGAAVTGAAGSATAAISGAVDGLTSAVSGAVNALASAASAAVELASNAAASLASVPGAIAEVAVSFTGEIEDLVLEPHLQLCANAEYAKTKFERGPIWVRVENTPDEARASTDTLHLFSDSGDYDEQKAVSDFASETPDSVAVLFTDCPMNESYTLEVLPENGPAIAVFVEVPYAHMRKSQGEFLDGAGSAASPAGGEAETETSTRTLRLKLTDYDFTPYAGWAYRVVSADGATVLSQDGATTDDQGGVEVDLPVGVARVRIAVLPAGGSEAAAEWTVDVVEELPPMSRERAVLIRLFHLGYFVGEPGDSWGEDEMTAMRWFQAENELDITGETDDASWAKLVELHGT